MSNRQGADLGDFVPSSPDGSDGIHGRVVTSDRVAVSGAMVAISGGRPHPDIAAITDDEGKFCLGDLSPGGYQLTVHKQGYEPASAQFELPTRHPITVVLRQG